MDVYSFIFYGCQSALAVCFAFYVFLIYVNSDTGDDKHLLQTVIAYMLAHAVSVGLSVFYTTIPFLYVVTSPFLLFSLLITPVLFYSMIAHFTNRKTTRKELQFHWILPVVGTIIWYVVTSTLTVEARIGVVANFGVPVGNAPVKESYFASLVLQSLSMHLVYLAFSGYRYRKYRKREKESSSRNQYKLRWIGTLIALSGIWIFFLIVSSLSGNRQSLFGYGYAILMCVTMGCLQFVLVVNILRENYPSRSRKALVPENSPEESFIVAGQHEADPHSFFLQKKTEPVLEKVSFEAWVRRARPYLNPQYKLTDAAAAFGVNRTAMSKFINTTYGVNFNSYLNRSRLREVERLRRTKRYGELTAAKLAERAGFGSYDSYQRSLKQERKGKKEVANE